MNKLFGPWSMPLPGAAVGKTFLFLLVLLPTNPCSAKSLQVIAPARLLPSAPARLLPCGYNNKNPAPARPLPCGYNNKNNKNKKTQKILKFCYATGQCISTKKYVTFANLIYVRKNLSAATKSSNLVVSTPAAESVSLVANKKFSTSS
ncbi:MAG: hypothetical protein ACK48W_01580 [Bacteroidota bacterium]|jgi:hypothetical protein